MELQFSIIIPVYNRPTEIDELLQSLVTQTYNKDFEVLVVEDGSSSDAKEIVANYQNQLNLRYLYKDNTGAGASRNYGMQRAKGNYFIIFDSDCIIPPQYLEEVSKQLSQNYTDAYGGADAAHPTFTTLQKAINYSMTSFFTTGGIRGSKRTVNKFQPRSFNMGISKRAFERIQGFSTLKIGEDIDLTFRLWEHGFETQFIEKAFVYHKRRSTLKQFFKQTFAFGKARPFLNKKFPGTAKITYWFPTFFVVFFLVSVFGGVLFSLFYLLPLVFYFQLIVVDAFIKTKSLTTALWSVVTTIVQFFGYGLGFVKGKLNL